ncbi:hypothetical protein ABT248_18570 [Streptomyces sp. NPDC000971]|uniref:hypothetical protein n=1 Tax=Streptomyces sp. NPDC000971 TaxID=3156647 RepID=UPI00332C552E
MRRQLRHAVRVLVPLHPRRSDPERIRVLPDRPRVVRPLTTGPYTAWQVAGLVLTLLAPLYWAASRPSIAGPVVGITAGLTVAAAYDWSDDASGLFVIGVAMLMAGSLLATARHRSRGPRTAVSREG